MTDPIIQESGCYRRFSTTSYEPGPSFPAPVNALTNNYRSREVVSIPSEKGAASFVSAQPETAVPKRSFFMTLIRRVFQPADPEKAKRIKEEKQALKDRVAKAKRLITEFEALNKLFKENIKAEQIRTNNFSITENAPRVYDKTLAEFNDKKGTPLNDSGFSWKRLFNKKENTSVQMKLRRAAAKKVRQAMAQERMASSSPNGDTCANTPPSQGVLNSTTPLPKAPKTSDAEVRVEKTKSANCAVTRTNGPGVLAMTKRLTNPVKKLNELDKRPPISARERLPKGGVSDIAGRFSANNSNNGRTA